MEISEIREKLWGIPSFHDWYLILEALVDWDSDEVGFEVVFDTVNKYSKKIPYPFCNFNIDPVSIYIVDPEDEGDFIYLGALNNPKAQRVLAFAKKINLLFTYGKKGRGCNISSLSQDALLHVENCTITSGDDGIGDAMNYRALEKLFVWMAEIGIMSGIEMCLHDYSKFSDKGLRKIFSFITHMRLVSASEESIRRFMQFKSPKLKVLGIRNTGNTILIEEYIQQLTTLECVIVQSLHEFAYAAERQISQIIKRNKIPKNIRAMQRPIDSIRGLQSNLSSLKLESVLLSDCILWGDTGAMELLFNVNFGENANPLKAGMIFLERVDDIDEEKEKLDAVAILSFLHFIKRMIQDNLKVISLPEYLYEKTKWFFESHPDVTVLNSVSMFDYYVERSRS